MAIRPKEMHRRIRSKTGGGQQMTHDLWWFVLSLCGVTPATAILAHISGLVLAGMAVGHAVNFIDEIFVD